MLSERLQSEPQATDFLYLGLELALVLSEWISDGQQWS